jgi:hypothetical protein
MYYSHPCSYCGNIFYTFQDDKQRASSVLYYGIKKHLIDYNEDHKEYKFDDGANLDINEIYNAVGESNDPPPGGQEL